MTAEQRQQLSEIGRFFTGLGELLAFVLTVIGALASFLVGHWDVEPPHGPSGEAYRPPRVG